MARLLVTHDTREDVYAEIVILGEFGDGDWDYRCTCGQTGSAEGVRSGSLRDTVEAALIHVDRTHRSL